MKVKFGWDWDEISQITADDTDLIQTILNKPKGKGYAYLHYICKLQRPNHSPTVNSDPMSLAVSDPKITTIGNGTYVGDFLKALDWKFQSPLTALNWIMNHGKLPEEELYYFNAAKGKNTFYKPPKTMKS